MSLNDLMRADVESLFFAEQDFGITGTYQRGAVTVTIVAIPIDPQQVQQQFRDGRNLAARRREWKIRVSDLASLGDPKTGDMVRVSGVTYQVAPTDTDREWSWDDTLNLVYRIRTIQKNETP